MTPDVPGPTRRGAIRNVIVCARAGQRFAIELRWVREVISLGTITPVPTAPPSIHGAVNYHGAIVPLLATPSDAEVTRAPRAGDGAVILEFEGVRAAIAVDTIDEVSTLAQTPDGLTLIDVRGRELAILDVPRLVARARPAIAAAPSTGDDSELS